MKVVATIQAEMIFSEMIQEEMTLEAMIFLVTIPVARKAEKKEQKAKETKQIVSLQRSYLQLT